MHLNIFGNSAAICNEPIEVTERRRGYFPQAFLWHGHCCRVHAVERCWTALKHRQDAGQLCFLVRCAEGRFEVHQNLALNTWRVHKAEWQAN